MAAKKAGTKRRAKKSTEDRNEPTIGLRINPFGPTQQRKIAESKIGRSVYTLSDGTKLVVTPMISDVRRAVGQYNENGQPLYFLTLGSTIVTKAPENLLRATATKAKRRK